MANKPLRKPDMTSKEYREAIAKLGLSQRTAGDFFGFSTRQSRRLAAGDAEVSIPLQMLLRVMQTCGLTPKAVDGMTAGPVTPKRPAKGAAASA